MRKAGVFELYQRFYWVLIYEHTKRPTFSLVNIAALLYRAFSLAGRFSRANKMINGRTGYGTPIFHKRSARFIHRSSEVPAQSIVITSKSISSTRFPQAKPMNLLVKTMCDQTCLDSQQNHRKWKTQ